MGCKQSTLVREHDRHGRRSTSSRQRVSESKPRTLDAKQEETSIKKPEENHTPKVQEGEEEETPAVVAVETDESKAMAIEDVDAGTSSETSVEEVEVQEEEAQEQINGESDEVEEIVNEIVEQLIDDAVNEVAEQFEVQDKSVEEETNLETVKEEEEITADTMEEVAVGETPVEITDEVVVVEEEAPVGATEKAADEASEEVAEEVDEGIVETQELILEVEVVQVELTTEEEEKVAASVEEEAVVEPVEEQEAVEETTEEEEVVEVTKETEDLEVDQVAVKAEAAEEEEVQEAETVVVIVEEEARGLELEEFEEEEPQDHHQQGGLRGSIALSDFSLEEDDTLVASVVVDELDHALQELDEETSLPPSSQVSLPPLLSASESQVQLQSQSQVGSFNPFASSYQKQTQQQHSYRPATNGSHPPSVARSAPRSSTLKFCVEKTSYEEGFVTYHIQLTIAGEKAWTRPMKKRYNDFKELHKDLISYAPGLEEEMPKLPNASLRTMWRGRKDESTIKKRAARFEQILYFIANHDVLINSPIFQAFIAH